MSKNLTIGDVLDTVSITHKFNKDKLIFLNTSDVLEGEILTHAYMPVSEMKGQAKKTIQNGDILFSEIRPKNKRYAYVDVTNSEDYVVSTKLMVLRNKTTDVLTKYIYYFLTYEETLNYLQMRAENRICSFPQITFDVVKPLAIKVPSLPQQQKIIDIISAIDAKIELNNRINAELESLAKTIYDYWFVQFDFPNSDGKPYKSSGGKMEYVGDRDQAIPAGWEVGKISKLLKINPLETLSKETSSPYIDMNAIPTSGFMTGGIQYKQYNGGMKFRNGDVVMARITPCLENGKTALITLLNENEIGFGSTEFIVLRGKNKPLSSFSACLSRSIAFRNFAISNMTGTSGRKRVDAKTIERFLIPIPDDGLISQFEDIVSKNFQLLTINTKKNQQLTQLRDWLLPMLMNGQVSVK